MFIGIIEVQGYVVVLMFSGGDVMLCIYSDELDFGDVKLGDLIVVNGVCLIVIVLVGGDSFSVDVFGEILLLIFLKQFKSGSWVNLEKVMMFLMCMGGYLVSGYVDGLGIVKVMILDVCLVCIDIEVLKELVCYIVQKGLIIVDGISLMVNSVDGVVFLLNIIFYIQDVIIIQDWKLGMLVNLEVDIIVCYLEWLLFGECVVQFGLEGLFMLFLVEYGFLKQFVVVV